MTGYPYTDRNLLAEREDYFYSQLRGPTFVADFAAARRSLRDALPKTDARPLPSAALPVSIDGPVDARAALAALAIARDPLWLDRFVRRFEISKRLYPAYARGLTGPDGPADDLDIYALFALALARGHAGHVARINALLKVCDILCSQSADGRASVAPWLREALDAEADALATLGREEPAND